MWKFNWNFGWAKNAHHNFLLIRRIGIRYTQGIRTKLGLLTSCLVEAMVGHVSAAELPKESVLPLASAMKAAHATVNRCFADGY